MKNTVISAVGIEFDSKLIRAVKLTPGKGRGSSRQMEQMELRGDYSREPDLIDALKVISHSMGVKKNAHVVTSLWGRQAFVTELEVKRGTSQEIRTAVQFELRKSVPFDVTMATLDFHEIGENRPDNETMWIVVGAASPVLYKHHLKVLESVDIKPEIVDFLPFAICTAVQESGVDENCSGAHVILHIGSEVATLIINDEEVPGSFYHRSIYFTSDEIFLETELTDDEISKRFTALVDEVNRSVLFYRKNYNFPLNNSLILCGNHTEQKLFDSALVHTELQLKRLTLMSGIESSLPQEAHCCWAIPATLASRALEEVPHE